MNILLITQKVDVNDPVLGFFVRWVEEFSKHCEKVTVICLYEGEHSLPKNVKVLSLGKESGVSRFTYILRFYKYIFSESKNYDSVFVHMNQVYILLGFKAWWLMRKRVGLWYAHGSVSTSLRVALKLTNLIFTSTESGFRLKSKKKRVVGQGIDTNTFKPSSGKENGETFKLISVGRISPVKDYETMIAAIDTLLQRGISIDATIIGGAPAKGQERYLDRIKSIVEKKNLSSTIHFLGAIPNKDILKHLQSSDLFINTSHTGSLDKAMLEAMSSGIPVVTCNEAMLEVLGEYKDTLMYSKEKPKELADKIEFIINLTSEDKDRISRDLRDIVVRDHDISQFVKKILAHY